MALASNTCTLIRAIVDISKQVFDTGPLKDITKGDIHGGTQAD